MKPGIRHPLTRASLSQYDQCPVAVVLDSQLDIVCTGVASYQHDEVLGYVLRVRLSESEPGNPVITLSEQRWRGEIVPDSRYGMSYCFIPAQEESS